MQNILETITKDPTSGEILLDPNVLYFAKAHSSNRSDIYFMGGKRTLKPNNLHFEDNIYSVWPFEIPLYILDEESDNPVVIGTNSNCGSLYEIELVQNDKKKQVHFSKYNTKTKTLNVFENLIVNLISGTDPQEIRFSDEQGEYGEIEGAIPCAEIIHAQVQSIAWTLYAWQNEETGSLTIEAVAPKIGNMRVYDNVFFQDKEAAENGNGYGRGEITRVDADMLALVAAHIYDSVLAPA